MLVGLSGLAVSALLSILLLCLCDHILPAIFILQPAETNKRSRVVVVSSVPVRTFGTTCKLRYRKH